MADNAVISPEDLFIPVLGMTGAGKSTFISTCTGDLAVEIGHGVLSCTSKVSMHTMKHMDKTIHLVDTPGLNDSNENDGDILQEFAYWLTAAHERKLRIAGIIYLHSITDAKFQGSHIRALKAFKAIVGSENYKSVILASTRWNVPASSEQEFQQRTINHQDLCTSGKYWGDMVAAGAKTVALRDQRHDALSIVTSLVGQDWYCTLALQRQLIEEGKSLQESDAGKIIYEYLSDEFNKLQMELQEARADLQASLAAENERNIKANQEVIDEITKRLEFQNQKLSNLSVSQTRLYDRWNSVVESDARTLQSQADAQDIILATKQHELSRLRQGAAGESMARQLQIEAEMRELRREVDRLHMVANAAPTRKYSRFDRGMHVINTMCNVVNTGSAAVQAGASVVTASSSVIQAGSSVVQAGSSVVQAGSSIVQAGGAAAQPVAQILSCAVM